MLLLEVKLYQGIDDELVGNETQRGTAKGAAEGLSHFAESGVHCRVVGHGEGRAGGVSGKESKVWCGVRQRITALQKVSCRRETDINNPPFGMR